MAFPDSRGQVPTVERLTERLESGYLWEHGMCDCSRTLVHDVQWPWGLGSQVGQGVYEITAVYGDAEPPFSGWATGPPAVTSHIQTHGPTSCLAVDFIHSPLRLDLVAPPPARLCRA